MAHPPSWEVVLPTISNMNRHPWLTLLERFLERGGPTLPRLLPSVLGARESCDTAADGRVALLRRLPVASLPNGAPPEVRVRGLARICSFRR